MMTDNEGKEVDPLKAVYKARPLILLKSLIL